MRPGGDCFQCSTFGRHLIPNLLEHAQANGILPDIVMLHSLMDAYIHWGKPEKAEEILEFLENPHLHFGSISGEASGGIAVGEVSGGNV